MPILRRRIMLAGGLTYIPFQEPDWSKRKSDETKRSFFGGGLSKAPAAIDNKQEQISEEVSSMKTSDFGGFEHAKSMQQTLGSEETKNMDNRMQAATSNKPNGGSPKMVMRNTTFGIHLTECKGKLSCDCINLIKPALSTPAAQIEKDERFLLNVYYSECAHSLFIYRRKPENMEVAEKIMKNKHNLVNDFELLVSVYYQFYIGELFRELKKVFDINIEEKCDRCIRITRDALKLKIRFTKEDIQNRVWWALKNVIDSKVPTEGTQSTAANDESESFV